MAEEGWSGGNPVNHSAAPFNRRKFEAAFRDLIPAVNFLADFQVRFVLP